MSGAMTEANLEDIVIEYLQGEGWDYRIGGVIAPGEEAAERTDYRDVLLVGRLRAALIKLNPDLPMDSIEDAINTVLRVESQVVMSENWRTYQLLTQGVPVQMRKEDGIIRDIRAQLIDWDSPENNDFLAVNQFTVIGKTKRRPDLILFVNGLPLALMELKRPGDENASLRGAFNQIHTYLDQIPDVFTWNQITVISDGVQARAGTFTSAWEHYAPWKTIDGANIVGGHVPQIEVLIRGMFEPSRFLDLIRNFTVFAGEVEIVKKTAKYHQYWAVNKAVQSTIDAGEVDGRAGL